MAYVDNVQPGDVYYNKTLNAAQWDIGANEYREAESSVNWGDLPMEHFTKDQLLGILEQIADKLAKGEPVPELQFRDIVTRKNWDAVQRYKKQHEDQKLQAIARQIAANQVEIQMNPPMYTDNITWNNTGPFRLLGDNSDVSQGQGS